MNSPQPTHESELSFDSAGGGGARLGRPRRKGVLPKRAVRTAAFGVISLTIFACGALCLLAVWDYTTSGVPWRALASLGIIAGTMGAFAVVNGLFGEAELKAAAAGE